MKRDGSDTADGEMIGYRCHLCNAPGKADRYEAELETMESDLTDASLAEFRLLLLCHPR